MTWEEYVAKDGQIATEQEWEAAGKPAPGSKGEKDYLENKTSIMGAGTAGLPATAQEAIPRELYFDPPTKTWYGIGPDNKAYPVDPTLGQMKFAAYQAKYQPPQAPSLTFPRQPDPYEGMPPEELPEWAPGFWKTQFERAQNPAYQGGKVQPYTVTTLPDGSTGYLLSNGQWSQLTAPTKKTTDMSTPPNGVKQYTDPYGKVMTWTLVDPTTGRYDYKETGYDPTGDRSRGMTEYQKEQLELQRQGGERETTQLAYQRSRDLATQAAAKEQRLAELAARPINWLQYAAETKTPPVVQPWMMPLAQEQYGWQVGQPIPGVSMGTRAQAIGGEPQFFSEEERQRYANPPTQPAPAGQDWRFFAGDWRLRNKEGAMAGSETLPTTAQGMNFENLPELRPPGAQLWARWGPTAQQQYYGYQQAATGISPEESEFRRQSTLPPGGRAPRWVWSR